MTRLILNIDLMPGADVKACAEDMRAFAAKHGVCLRASFNGSHMFAHPRSTVDDVMSDWTADMKRARSKAEGA